MKDKNWKEMNGWEKAWEVTQIAVGCVVGIGMLLLGLFGGGKHSRGGGPGGGGSNGGGGRVWTVGGGGKKPGSWSSFRHKQR